MCLTNCSPVYAADALNGVLSIERIKLLGPCRVYLTMKLLSLERVELKIVLEVRWQRKTVYVTWYWFSDGVQQSDSTELL